MKDDDNDKKDNTSSSNTSNASEINQTSDAELKDGYYEVNGVRFSKYYYERLWNIGRKASSLTVREILKNCKKITPDPKPGFMRYEVDGWELIYNEATKEVWHLLQVK